MRCIVVANFTLVKLDNGKLKKYKVTMDQEKERALPVFKKWGYYASGYNVKKDALRPRSWILKNNCNLGFRQIFGPNARAEILSFLVEKPKSYIQDIPKKIKMSYPPVYYEIESMIKSGLVTCELIGRMKIISLPESSVRFLKAVPF